jgi:hypothetical protein
VCNCLIQFFYSLWFFKLRNVFRKCIATFRTHCRSHSQFLERALKRKFNQQVPPADNPHPSTICAEFPTIHLYASVSLRLWYRRSTFSSVVRQMPGYNSQRRGTARTYQLIFMLYLIFIVMHVQFCDCYICSVRRVLCTVCV